MTARPGDEHHEHLALGGLEAARLHNRPEAAA
jgi:hypothetical protein